MCLLTTQTPLHGPFFMANPALFQKDPLFEARMTQVGQKCLIASGVDTRPYSERRDAK